MFCLESENVVQKCVDSLGLRVLDAGRGSEINLNLKDEDETSRK